MDGDGRRGAEEEEEDPESVEGVGGGTGKDEREKTGKERYKDGGGRGKGGAAWHMERGGCHAHIDCAWEPPKRTSGKWEKVDTKRGGVVGPGSGRGP